MRLGIRIAELILEVLLHLAHKLVGKVAVCVGRLLLGNQIGIFDAVVDIVRERFLLLFLGDVPLPQHIAEYHLPLLLICLPPRDGVEPRGVLGDAGQHRALGEGKILDFFVKVAARRHLDTERVAAEVNRVQVVGQNLFFAHHLLEFERQILLLNFSGQLLTEAFFPTAVEEVVFNELLGNGRAAARTRSAAQHTHNGAHNGARVDTVVLPETLVLNCDKGIHEVLRKLLIRRFLAIGARHDQGFDQISVRIVNRGGKAHGGDAVRLEFRRGVHNAPKGACRKGRTERRS